MDYLHSTTSKRKKGQHFTYEERIKIEIRMTDHWSVNQIAQEIGCAPNTIRNEIKRGTVSSENVHRYKASLGQEVYKKNRK